MNSEMHRHDTLKNGTADPKFDQRYQNHEQNKQKTEHSSSDFIKHENSDVEEVIDNIGSGGQCVGVYKIKNIHGEYQALKVVKKDKTTNNPSTRKEIEILKNLPDHGIVQLKKVKENEDHIFIHMELMEGSMEKIIGSKPGEDNFEEMLRFKRYCLQEKYCPDLVDQAGKTIGMRLDWISDWMRSVLEAISTIHEKGIVHSDVKLENIFYKMVNGDFQTLGDSGNIKVADLGCCQPDGGHIVSGTMRNFAPECFIIEEILKACQTQTHNEHLADLAQKISLRISQIGQATKSTGIQDYKGISTKVDIWALGLAVVYMAIGEDLFTESTRQSVVIGECLVPDQHNFKYTFNEAIRRMPEYLKSDILYDSFKDFLRKCLEHCPEDRPSAKELMKMDFITKKRKRKRTDEKDNTNRFGDKRSRMNGPVDCPGEEE